MFVSYPIRYSEAKPFEPAGVQAIPAIAPLSVVGTVS